jgi:multidrug efflux pump
VENIHRHLEEGMPPVQASLKGAREIVGPVVSMTITLAAVYAPIGFLGGLTGSLFREFAFTLAGSVIVSGVIALTLSPMMCSVFLKTAEEGRFARLVTKVFGAMTRWYGRKLDRSLDYRPITGLFALTILGLVGFLYMYTSKELAPEEDQGIVFAVTKAPKYANIDYLDYYGEKLDKAFQKFPETDLRFVLNGINGPQNGIAGMLLTPWDERTRSSIKLKPLVQAELSKVEGISAFAFNLPPLPGNPGGLPVQMVINSTNSFQAVYAQMQKLKDAARKSGLFIVTDSDLAFNQPVVRIKVDRSKANDLGITMQNVGAAIATLLGGNYVNRFNLEGRSYQVIPQVPRERRIIFVNGLGCGLLSICLTANLVGYFLAANLSQTLGSAILMLTPLAFLFSTARNSRTLADMLALVLGLVLYPVAALMNSGLDILVSGVVAGTIAYGMHKWREQP